MPRTFCRSAYDCARELEGLRSTWPLPEIVSEPARGEVRLAAEVAVAELRGTLVPTWIHERAFDTLNRIAFE